MDKLAFKVFKQALKDFNLDLSKKHGKALIEAQEIKQEAIDFFTIYNKDLEYWCDRAGFDTKNVVNTMVNADTVYIDKLLKYIDKLEE